MDRLGLFPLRTVLVPGAALRLHVFEDRYKEMIGACIDGGEPFGVVLNRNERETGDDFDPVAIGTTAHIQEVTRLPQGRLYIVTRGGRRFHVDRVVQKTPFWSAEVSYLAERVGPRDAARRQRDAALELFREYVRSLLSFFGRDIETIDLPRDATSSSYVIADALQIASPAKQVLLEAETAAERLSAELDLLGQETQRLQAMLADGLTAAKLQARSPLGVKFSQN
jgi:uncharacterized protein